MTETNPIIGGASERWIARISTFTFVIICLLASVFGAFLGFVVGFILYLAGLKNDEALGAALVLLVFIGFIVPIVWLIVARSRAKPAQETSPRPRPSPPVREPIVTRTQRSETNFPKAETLTRREKDSAGAATEKENGEWYYFERNNRIGPVTEEKLKNLYERNEIDESTQVWKPGFEGWITLGKSGISGIVIRQTPPPVAEHLVSNGIVWTIAFLPIVFVLANYIWLTIWHGEWLAQVYYYSGRGLFGLIQQAIIYTALCILDQRRLKNAGYDVERLLPAAFILPVYLFVRASALKHPPYYGFVWLICFVLVLFF